MDKINLSLGANGVGVVNCKGKDVFIPTVNETAELIPVIGLADT